MMQLAAICCLSHLNFRGVRVVLFIGGVIIIGVTIQVHTLLLKHGWGDVARARCLDRIRGTVENLVGHIR